MYSSRYVFTAAGSSFLQYTCVHQQQVYAVHTSVGAVRAYRMQGQQVPIYSAALPFSFKIYTYVHEQRSSYLCQYVVRHGQQQVIIRARTVGTVVGTVGTYIHKQVHQQVQYVRKYSSSRCSSTFSGYGHDLIVETWGRHQPWGVKYHCLLTNVVFYMRCFANTRIPGT